MKKKIIVLCGVMIFALLGFIGTTVAWLTSTGSKPQTVTIGEVEYTFEKDLTSAGTVVPGQPLISEELTFTNSSTVLSQLRFTITLTTTATVDQLTVSNLVFKDDKGDTVETFDGWVKVKEEDVDYYYYGGTDSDIDIDTDPATTFLKYLCFNGETVGNKHAGQVVTITITFQAKQADYVSWTDLADYSFDTGLAS